MVENSPVSIYAYNITFSTSFALINGTSPCRGRLSGSGAELIYY
jgi:hypothetical protein